MNIVEDILDLVVFIFFLGGVIVFGFMLVIPVANSLGSDIDLSLADKTAPTLLGDENISSLDGSLSKLEVVLMTQVQDDNLPFPKQYKVNDMTAEVDMYYPSAYYLDLYGNQAYASLHSTDPNNIRRYDVVFRHNNSTRISEGEYSVERR